MTVVLAFAGAFIGALAGLFSLWLTSLRARAAVGGRQRWALATFPAVIVLAAFGVFAAALLSPIAAWTAAGGLILARAVALHFLKGAP